MSATPSLSEPRLLALHAVRLLGFADDERVAARFALGPDVVGELLLDFEAYGWVTRTEFAGTRGWSLTDRGRAEDERALAAELDDVGHRAGVATAYRAFLAENQTLMRACTDWQVRPTSLDVLAPNDHTDAAWDRRVLRELADLQPGLDEVVRVLVAGLPRFAGYDVRYGTALRRSRYGDHQWVDGVGLDSCHTVWMQLHEDLLATLGVARGEEPPAR